MKAFAPLFFCAALAVGAARAQDPSSPPKDPPPPNCGAHAVATLERVKGHRRWACETCPAPLVATEIGQGSDGRPHVACRGPGGHPS
jgi:hypothetical protein